MEMGEASSSSSSVDGDGPRLIMGEDGKPCLCLDSLDLSRGTRLQSIALTQNQSTHRINCEMSL